jgi:hypothetical protein
MRCFKKGYIRTFMLDLRTDKSSWEVNYLRAIVLWALGLLRQGRKSKALRRLVMCRPCKAEMLQDFTRQATVCDLATGGGGGCW